MIYHVASNTEWERQKTSGFFEAASLQTEGFIHTSRKEQIPGVLERYYSEAKDIILLHIDETKLTSALKEELAPSVNEFFPHIYGPLNVDAVIKTERI